MKTLVFPFPLKKSSCFILIITFFLISCSDNNIPHIAYYDNGNKKEEGTFKSGEKHGKWFNWYNDGTKKSEGSYKEGLMNGKWIFFYENELVKAKVTYIKGSGEGSIDDIPSEGLEGECIFFYDNGTKKSEHFYKKGKMEGLQLGWHSNGEKDSEVSF